MAGLGRLSAKQKYNTEPKPIPRPEKLTQLHFGILKKGTLESPSHAMLPSPQEILQTRHQPYQTKPRLNHKIQSLTPYQEKNKPKETSSVLGRNEQMLYGVTKSRPGRPAESHSRNHASHLVCSVRFIPDQGMERDMDNWTYMDRSCASLHDLSNFNPIAIIRYVLLLGSSG